MPQVERRRSVRRLCASSTITSPHPPPATAMHLPVSSSAIAQGLTPTRLSSSGAPERASSMMRLSASPHSA